MVFLIKLVIVYYFIALPFKLQQREKFGLFYYNDNKYTIVTLINHITGNGMRNTRFYKLGQAIYPIRWIIIILWILIVISCLPFLPKITSPFKSTGFIDETAQSSIASEYINEKLGFDYDNRILILYTSNKIKTTNPLFFKKIKDSLKEVKDFPVETVIFYPDENEKQVAKNKKSAYAVIVFKKQEPLTTQELSEVKTLINTPSNMTLEMGGDPVFMEKVDKQTQKDLYSADIIVAPIALIILLLVFGSVVAALIPLVLGAGAALIILTSLFLIGHITNLSIFTLNIALLLGICLTLDYSLFIISRFREELTQTKSVKLAIAQTQSTAGKAIFFSGLAVMTSLSALLLFPVNILYSVAIGGITAVSIAVLCAIILLPALLGVLNTKINFLKVSFLTNNKSKKSHFWHWIATKVVKNPIRFFILIFLFLLLLGYPFLHAKFGISDYRIFPHGSEPRHFFDDYEEKFNKHELSPIIMLTITENPPMLSKENIRNLYDLTNKIEDNAIVQEVNSIVSTEPRLTKEQYSNFYNTPKNLTMPGIKELLDTTTGRSFTIINITSKYDADSSQTKKLINELENISDQKNLSSEITGRPVSNLDVLDAIKRVLPFAILWIMFFTYILLLILLRSLFLPLKAIFMTLLSLCACYGALVLIFQEGYLHQLLNFEPQGMLDISLLVIIFCALFGFSMDYEVFLLTRIKEAHDQFQDNDKSIVYGIEKSSRIITSAALIVIFICISFLTADNLMVKAVGLGIAVAIFVDAFLIRTFLVPATMTLLKKLNWYLPKWLDKVLPRI